MEQQDLEQMEKKLTSNHQKIHSFDFNGWLGISSQQQANQMCEMSQQNNCGLRIPIHAQSSSQSKLADQLPIEKEDGSKLLSGPSPVRKMRSGVNNSPQLSTLPPIEFTSYESDLRKNENELRSQNARDGAQTYLVSCTTPSKDFYSGEPTSKTKKEKTSESSMRLETDECNYVSSNSKSSVYNRHDQVKSPAGFQPPMEIGRASLLGQDQNFMQPSRLKPCFHVEPVDSSRSENQIQDASSLCFEVDRIKTDEFDERCVNLLTTEEIIKVNRVVSQVQDTNRTNLKTFMSSGTREREDDESSHNELQEFGNRQVESRYTLNYKVNKQNSTSEMRSSEYVPSSCARDLDHIKSHNFGIPTISHRHSQSQFSDKTDQLVFEKQVQEQLPFQVAFQESNQNSEIGPEQFFHQNNSHVLRIQTSYGAKLSQDQNLRVIVENNRAENESSESMSPQVAEEHDNTELLTYNNSRNSESDTQQNNRSSIIQAKDDENLNFNDVEKQEDLTRKTSLPCQVQSADTSSQVSLPEKQVEVGKNKTKKETKTVYLRLMPESPQDSSSEGDNFLKRSVQAVQFVQNFNETEPINEIKTQKNKLIVVQQIDQEEESDQQYREMFNERDQKGTYLERQLQKQESQSSASQSMRRSPEETFINLRNVSSVPSGQFTDSSPIAEELLAARRIKKLKILKDEAHKFEHHDVHCRFQTSSQSVIEEDFRMYTQDNDTYVCTQNSPTIDGPDGQEACKSITSGSQNTNRYLDQEIHIQKRQSTEQIGKDEMQMNYFNHLMSGDQKVQQLLVRFGASEVILEENDEQLNSQQSCVPSPEPKYGSSQKREHLSILMASKSNTQSFDHLSISPKLQKSYFSSNSKQFKCGDIYENVKINFDQNSFSMSGMIPCEVESLNQSEVLTIDSQQTHEIQPKVSSEHVFDTLKQQVGISNKYRSYISNTANMKPRKQQTTISDHLSLGNLHKFKSQDFSNTISGSTFLTDKNDEVDLAKTIDIRGPMIAKKANKKHLNHSNHSKMRHPKKTQLKNNELDKNSSEIKAQKVPSLTQIRNFTSTLVQFPSTYTRFYEVFKQKAAQNWTNAGSLKLSKKSSMNSNLSESPMQTKAKKKRPSSAEILVKKKQKKSVLTSETKYFQIKQLSDQQINERATQKLSSQRPKQSLNQKTSKQQKSQTKTSQQNIPSSAKTLQIDEKKLYMTPDLMATKNAILSRNSLIKRGQSSNNTKDISNDSGILSPMITSYIKTGPKTAKTSVILSPNIDTSKQSKIHLNQTEGSNTVNKQNKSNKVLSGQTVQQQHRASAIKTKLSQLRSLLDAQLQVNTVLSPPALKLDSLGINSPLLQHNSQQSIEKKKKMLKKTQNGKQTHLLNSISTAHGPLTNSQKQTSLMALRQEEEAAEAGSLSITSAGNLSAPHSVGPKLPITLSPPIKPHTSHKSGRAISVAISEAEMTGSGRQKQSGKCCENNIHGGQQTSSFGSQGIKDEDRVEVMRDLQNILTKQKEAVLENQSLFVCQKQELMQRGVQGEHCDASVGDKSTQNFRQADSGKTGNRTGKNQNVLYIPFRQIGNVLRAPQSQNMLQSKIN